MLFKNFVLNLIIIEAHCLWILSNNHIYSCTNTCIAFLFQDKSKLDWDSFKKKEGIEEELQIHNRGKEGYIERKQFLERTDLRQFEIEKSLRQKNKFS